MTDNFVNLLHISYAWLYKTECWGRKFHAFSFNSHRNCKIFMTNFNSIFDTICVPYIFRKSIFGWNCDHDTPLCDTPLLEDTPLCDTPDDMNMILLCIKKIWTTQKACTKSWTDRDTPSYTPTLPHPPVFSQENEDCRYVTAQPRTCSYVLSRQTEDVMRLDAIQPRMSPYTFNRGCALINIFTSFSSSHTPPLRKSRTVSGFLPVLGLL